MHIDKKHQEEIRRRKGLTIRTIIRLIWLAISVVGAYFLATLLFAQNSSLYTIFYAQLGLPRTVPPQLIFWLVIVLIVAILQIFLILGFFLAAPNAWRRSGKPSLYSRNPEPFDDRF